MKSVRILFDGFKKFCRSSGLEANLSKSQVYFGGVAVEIKDDILRSVALGEGQFPLKYLGISLRPTRWLIVDCGEILKKIHNRLHVWASRHLSFAGRTQLIYSVLHGMRNYWMNIVLLPISVVHEIDRLCRNFLWGERNNRSKFHCSSWPQVCLRKVMGGLGFKEGCIWNKILLAKYLWALSSKQDVLWVKWIDGVYLKGKSIWDYHLKPDVSWYRHKICYLREDFSSKAVLGHLLTRDNLARCHIVIDSAACPLVRCCYVTEAVDQLEALAEREAKISDAPHLFSLSSCISVPYLV
ncbi:uncharacterized protein LOC133833003 [Humulus lupulus]|uniref:uncharacterized protein LOC133833003 n=1 Tax=Humulus lupulus TaxID=3486 RepID=UPI002B417F7A|nr:uncharacterized protein LOC133833003 [Humulus lupulus]